MTDSDLNRRIATLLPAQRAALMQRLHERGEATPRDHIPRRDPQQPAPLSFAQERLWFLTLLEPEGQAYNLGQAYHLNGPLNAGALEKSIEEILRRHEALRTTFASEVGRPVQVIVPHRQLKLPIIDLTATPREERLADAMRRAEAEFCIPFNLRSGPLMRATLLRLGEKQHVLVITLHHIVFDGWSGDIFRRELSVFYGAICEGREPGWPDLPIQYADYAVWHRHDLQNGKLGMSLEYWRGRLAGAAALELPTDRPRPPRSTYSGARCTFVLGAELSARLGKFNRQEKVTAFMSLLAAFEVLLYRYSGQVNFMVGTPVANRGNVEVEGLIGFFVNSLVMRADLSGDPSFREVVARTRRTALDGYQHQELPFEKLVEELNPQRDLSRHPLFQVMFALHNVPREALTLKGLEVSRIALASSSTRFDLELHLWSQGDDWSGSLVYCRDLFEQATVEAMGRHYVMLMEGMLAEPDRAVSQVPMLPDRERKRILIEWNQTTAEYPREQRIPELFERRAQQQPNAIALIRGEETISYEELNSRANQLAAHLQEYGVGNGTRVGLCMERSTEMICAILGVLKAGATYVPLDVSYPKERLNWLINDSEAVVVLTIEAFKDVLSETEVKVICLDLERSSWERRSRENIANSAQKSSDLAYVIYTSGSTGTPKGVAVSHRAVARLVLNTNYLDLGADDSVAHLSHVCFDAATFEIWGALLNGARLVVISKEASLDPELLAAVLRRQEISTLFLTTGLFNQLAAWSESMFKGIKQVLFGGEAVNPESVRHVLESEGPPHRLLHVYGPTECTTFAMFYPVSHVEKDARTIPIGRPISNTTAYVLDPHGNPLPIGVPGELHLGGPGVAEGYLHQPELTRERFVPDPFVADKTQRLYRTGDIVKFLPDGNIEFVGRADGQVKIRGFRIEPGEVEAVLKSHPGVQDALVLAQEDELEARRLVAYVVPENDGVAKDWRGFLQRTLPDYMIPSAFVVLDKLPLTPNGKVDRHALPAPGRKVAGYNAPRSPWEQIICKIFAEVLKLERVGIDDNFFALGGHSLLAIQIASRIRHTVGIDPPISALFRSPTVWELAREIEASARGAVETTCWLTRVSREHPLPLSFSQERMLCDCQTPDGQPVDGFRSAFTLSIKGALNVTLLERSINDLVRRHEALRTTFPIVSGQQVQFINPEVKLTLQMIDLTERPDSYLRAERFLTEEWSRPFDLINGPLFRVLLLRLRDANYRLVFSLHHLIYDGLSLEIFFRELGMLYSAYQSGNAYPLPKLSVDYGDFSAWQREHLQKGTPLYESQLAFWRKQFSESKLVPLDLPFRRSSPAEPDPRSSRLVKRMPHFLYQELDAFKTRHRASLFMVLLAAFKALLRLQTGSDDIALLLFNSNRRQTETNAMIGLFSNVICVHTNLAGDPDFVEILSRVRFSVLEAQERRDIPYQEVTAQLNPPSLSLVFSVNNEIPMPALAGLRVRSLKRHRPSMPWGFTLAVINRNSRLRSEARFDTRQYDPTGVEIFLQQYHHLLGKIVSDPDRRLSELMSEPGQDSDRPSKGLAQPDLSRSVPEKPLVENRFVKWLRSAFRG